MRRVVVTGMGIVSCLGNTKESVTDSLREGRSGIRFAPESLELWITHRLFQLDERARSAGLNCRGGLSQMAAVLGFELDPGFWSPLPPIG